MKTKKSSEAGKNLQNPNSPAALKSKASITLNKHKNNTNHPKKK